jgi:hypothetical protein
MIKIFSVEEWTEIYSKNTQIKTAETSENKNVAYFVV